MARPRSKLDGCLRSRLLQPLGVAVLFAILAVVATWPVITDPAHLSVVRPTDNDYRLTIYLIFWGSHALLTNPFGLHHTNMFYPERYTYAYGDMLLAQSILMLPIIEAFYNPILTYNMLLLISMVIEGVGFFLLAREVTGRRGAALVGACLWVFNPVRFGRYSQIQLFAAPWLPWLAWALWQWLNAPAAEPVALAAASGEDETRRHRRLADDTHGHRAPLASDRHSAVRGNGWPVAAAVFFCLHALSGSHNAVFGMLLAASMILYFAFARALWRDRRFVGGLLALGIIVAVVLGPIFWPYAMLEQQMAAKRAETLDIPNASARPFELLSAESRFYSWLDSRAGWPSVINRTNRELRTYLFPGVVPLLLGFLGVIWTERTQRIRLGFWVVSVALFFFLALGAYGGYVLVGNLPLIRLIRVPTRFMLPAVFGLTILAAYGVAAVGRRLRPGRRLGVLSLLIAAFVVEAMFAPLRTYPYEHRSRPINEFLAAEPGDFTVVEFPLDPRSYSINMRQAFNSIYHWKNILVGYSGYQSDANVRRLRTIRRRFPSDDSLDELEALDVRFVMVLQDRVDPSLVDAIGAQRRLSLVRAFDNRLVYRLDAAAGAGVR